MERHADRIRRIQELCTQLTCVIEESQRIQETAEALHRESRALLEDLRTRINASPSAASRWPA